MFSIVTMRHKHSKNDKVTIVLGTRLDGPYEDTQNTKAYTILELAKEAFENRVRMIETEEK